MFLYIMFAFAIIRFVILIVSNLKIPAFKLNLFKRKIRNADGLIRNNFIDAQVLFATEFNVLANVRLIKEIDSTKAYAVVKKNFADEVTAVYQYSTFDYNENEALFNVTIFVLKNEKVIEIGHDYAVLLYTPDDYTWANKLNVEFTACRIEARTKVIGFANAQAMN